MNRRRSPRLMILSIHPRHLVKILTGDKTVELRRTRPSVVPGEPVALYGTAPTSAVVATCTVDSVTIDTPIRLKPSVLRPAQITDREYTEYFGRNEQAVAIHLANVVELPTPITLGELRHADRWHPPQTWHFIPQERLSRVIGPHVSLAHLGALF